jgi:hypothetical protein
MDPGSQFLQGAGGELDADGGLGLEEELVAGEAGEDVGLADAGIADEDDLEQVVVLLLSSSTLSSLRLRRTEPCSAEL